MAKSRLTALAVSCGVVVLLAACAVPASASALTVASPMEVLPPVVVVPEPEPTVVPGPEPEPTEQPNPEPTEEPVDPVDPAPEPDPEPVPVPEVPAPVDPVEPPADAVIPDDEFEQPDVDEVVPVIPEETPTPTPTPSPTPIPAVDIFAPFYPPSSGAARDNMPLILGGSAVGLVVLAAIASFIASRIRLARMRRMTQVDVEQDRSRGAAVSRPRGPLPTNLDISALTGGQGTTSAAQIADLTGVYDLHLSPRSTPTSVAVGVDGFVVPGESRAKPVQSGGVDTSKQSLTGLLGARRPAATRKLTVLSLTGVLAPRLKASGASARYAMSDDMKRSVSSRSSDDPASAPARFAMPERPRARTT